ncbi:MAG TPA: protein kinase, partial [Anaerolineae bacterium]|nr:protein kinase [Anaerolineae bacterium]
MNLAGRDLGQYHVVELIGQGGMAAVYKAYQPALERHVAIKVLPEQLALVPDFSDRFVREAKAIAQLNHPNILPVMDFGQEDGLSYIVMKYVRGGTLADRLRRPIDLLTTTRLVEQIAAALDHAHSRGIIHRDVKPSNVLLDEGEWVQLADFGLAKIVARDEDLTGTGTGMGTPTYLSPEQGKGLPLDHRTDIYSLGVIVYEMVTGRPPFTGENLVAIVMKHIYEPPPLPRVTNPDVPEAVQAVMLKALAKSPADRFDSAGDLAHALRKAVTGSSPPAGVQVYGPGDAHVTPVLGLPELHVDVATLPHGLLITETVPGVAHFVGREQELAACRAKLERDRFLVLTGMAGVGKSTLGAKLARDVAGSPDRIFWFTFDRVEKSTTDALYWAVAAFLNNRGDSSLWRFLKGAVDAEKPLEQTARLNLLLSGLASGSYVLCFDDFHLVADVPEIVHVFKLIRHRFLDLRQELPGWFVIMGRDVPADLEYAVGAPLAGFTHEDAERFVASRSPRLSPALVLRLWQRTEGNAKLMELGASALAAVGDQPAAVESFFEAMGRRGDVREYLMTDIYAALTPDEQLIMGALSVFPGPVERAAAEHVLEAEGVSGMVPKIEALVNRHLIGAGEDERLRCHALVREYCYDILTRRDRERFHQRAAEYFEGERGYLAAAYHHFERRAYAQA